MKRIVIDGHALERAFQRNIGDDQIQDCIRNPETKCPDRDGRIRVEKDFGLKRLRVIYGETQQEILVITAVWV